MPSLGFVSAPLKRDWLSVLGHERNVSCNPPIKGLKGEAEREYLDRIAALMTSPEENFDELEKLSGDLDFDQARGGDCPKARWGISARYRTTDEAIGWYAGREIDAAGL